MRAGLSPLPAPAGREGRGGHRPVYRYGRVTRPRRANEGQYVTTPDVLLKLGASR